MTDYKELFNTSPLGIFVANLEGKYIDANEKALIQCGYSLEELLEINVMKLIHPDNLDYGMKMFAQTLKEGKSTFDLKFIKKNGEIGWWRLNGSISNDKVIAYVEEITEEKEDYLSILNKNELYLSLLELSYEGIWVVNNVGEIIDCNEAYLKKMGYTKSELIGKKVNDIDVLESEEDSINRMKEIRAKKILTFNTSHKTKYGFTLASTVTTKYDENRDLFYVFISESSKENEKNQDIAELNSLISLTLEAANAGFWYIEENNGILHWDFGLRNIYELNLDEEIDNEKWLSFIHPIDRSRVINRIQQAQQTKDYYKDEYRIITKKNKIKYIQSYAIFRKNIDGSLKISGINIDITNEIKNIQAINELRERFEIAIDSASIGIWDYNYKEDHLIWNKYMYEIFDVNEHTFGQKYKDFEDCLHPDDIERVKKEFFDAVKFNRLFDTEFRIIRKNGSITYIDAYGKLIKDPEGQPHRVYGINIDITHSVLEKIEIQKAREHAEESDKLKSAFLHNISHEIRTPLNAIIGFTNLLVEEKDEKNRVEFEKLIKKSSNRLIQVIDDIIDLSKIETGQYTLKKSMFDVQGTLEDLCYLYKELAAEKNLAFSCSFNPDKSIKVFNDSKLLIKTLSHLLSNAIKFTEKGSISLEHTHDNNEITFVITDTGCGIAEAMKDKVFDKFVQGDNEINRSYEGAGLGLAICKEYTQLMGGKIWFESEEGVGSKFYLKIPLKDSIENSVMIVEDNETSFTFLKILLQKHGFNIIRAYNGKDAIEKFESNNIILILMDMKLPIMNGYTATSIIRSKNSKVPIIAVTADAVDELVEKALNAGCNLHLAKPVDMVELEAAILELIGDNKK